MRREWNKAAGSARCGNAMILEYEHRLTLWYPAASSASMAHAVLTTWLPPSSCEYTCRGSGGRKRYCNYDDNYDDSIIQKLQLPGTNTRKINQSAAALQVVVHHQSGLWCLSQRRGYSMGSRQHIAFA